MSNNFFLNIHNTSINTKLINEVFSVDFVEHALGDDAYNRYFQLSVSSVRQVISAYLLWAEFVDFSDDSASSYLREYCNGDTPNKYNFLIHLYRLDQYLHVKHENSIGQRKKIRSGLNSIFKDLSNQGVVPSDLYLTSSTDKEKQISRLNSRRKIVVQAGSEVELDKEITSKVSCFIDSISLGNEDRNEIIDIVCNSIKELVVSNAVKFHDLDNLVEIWPIVEDALYYRLERIRDVSERVYNEEINKREAAIEKARNGVRFSRIISNYFTVSLGSGRNITNPYENEFNSLSKYEIECGFLAAYIDPASPFYLTGIHFKVPGYQRINKYRKHNDLGLADEMSASDLIGASTKLLVSAQVILIHELCANSGGVRSLKRNDLNNIGNVLASISWDKARAKTRYIGYEKLQSVHKKNSASEVFKSVKSITEGYVNWPYAGINFRTRPDGTTEHEMLFIKAREKKIINGYMEIKGCDDIWFNNHTKAILSEVADGITATSIRSSMILLDAIKNGETSARNKARHASKLAIRGYIYKLGFTDKLEAKIRKFLHWLEALVTLDIDDYAINAGYDQVDYKILQDRVRKDGFGGIICKDSNAGFQPLGDKNGCGLFLKCITCGNREPYFFATQENVLQLVLWGDAIEQSIDSGRIIKEFDCADDWSMWTIFIKTVYERLDSDPRYKSMLIEAISIVRGMKENPYLTLLRGN
ncbi:hypothetical protein ABFY09_12820 [Marinomonas sp. 5E14-1]|uniref:hypothetical protein n=1 Tax=Marinomonas sp. 5E14-1 TaxID=3153922 RepID=UPI003267D0CD